MENGSGALKAVLFLQYYVRNFMQLKDVTTGKAQPVEFSTCGILAKTKQWREPAFRLLRIRLKCTYLSKAVNMSMNGNGSWENLSVT